MTTQTRRPVPAGVSRCEAATVVTMEPLLDGSFVEREYNGYLWRCEACRHVWTKQHQARDCATRNHAATYQDGPYYRTLQTARGPVYEPHYYHRAAVRRDPPA